MRKPRDPLLKVLIICLLLQAAALFRVWIPAGGALERAPPDAEGRV